MFQTSRHPHYIIPPGNSRVDHKRHGTMQSRTPELILVSNEVTRSSEPIARVPPNATLSSSGTHLGPSELSANHLNPGVPRPTESEWCASTHEYAYGGYDIHFTVQRSFFERWKYTRGPSTSPSWHPGSVYYSLGMVLAFHLRPS